MIISHKYKFIFIKTTKTAGTSIEVALSKLCDEKDIVTPIIPPIVDHTPRNYEGFFNHISALKIKNQISPKLWDSYYKFCFERNPFDKSLSYYFWMKYDKKIDESIEFNEFCRNFGKQELPSDFGKYTDEKGNLMVDFIGKYETLLTDLSKVLDILQIPFEGKLTREKDTRFLRDKDYRKYYDEETKTLVEKIFKNELEMFDYKF